MDIFQWPLRKLNSTVWHIKRNRWRFNFYRHFVDLDSIKIDKPIFLLGTHGGGLTLLSRVLRRSPSVVSFTGNCRYWTGDDEMSDALISKLPEPLKGHQHLNIPSAKGSGWLYASDKYLPKVRKTEQDATPELSKSFKNIIRELIVLHSREPNQSRFTDKSQIFTLKVSFINALLMDCNPHFILVLRNPYVMCYRAAMNILSEEHLSYEEKLRKASEHWANSFLCALEDKEKVRNMLIIRFEDFLQHPEKVLQQICHFVDLEYNFKMLPQPGDRLPLGSPDDAKWYPLRPEVNEAYLRKIGKKEISIIDERCGDLAGKFKYKAK